MTRLSTWATFILFVAWECLLLRATVTGADDDLPRVRQCPVHNFGQKTNLLGCLTLRKVCFDQGTVILYSPEYQPSHPAARKIPKFDLAGLGYNWPNQHGNGDHFLHGAFLPLQPVLFRANTSLEAAEDLRNPTFSTCTRPMVLFTLWPFTYLETYLMAYTPVYYMRKAGFLPDDMTLVIGTPGGLKVPKFYQHWFGYMTPYELTSLADFSARQPETTPSRSTAEGRHVRCFESAAFCRNNDGRREWARGYTEAAEAAIETYKRRGKLPFSTSAFNGLGSDVMRVLVSIRLTTEKGTRALINQHEVVERCNAWKPPPGAHWGAIKCVPVAFGSDWYMEAALLHEADLLVAVHGSVLANGFFLQPGGSMLEIRPRGFGQSPTSFAQGYLRYLSKLDNGKVFWWGVNVEDGASWTPGEFEAAGGSHLNHNVMPRDRNVVLKPEVLEYMLAQVADTGRSYQKYMERFRAGTYYITDALQPVNDTIHKSGVAR